ncbi:uncharacterized protein LOC143447375 isoform X1 [Clavelina lepadiformis]|uniref:uncharacterized protein LOC143447375 isoform X1 n=1 Tax=Clavelina lepadiformis TaxID=159417 RepID=UPI0040418F9D
MEKMPFFLHVILTSLVLLSSDASTMTSRVMSENNERLDRCSYPTEKPAAGLESSSSGSDVIMTGTILQLEPEQASRSERNKFETGNQLPEGRTVTGHVKVWRVIKGSIDDIATKKRRKKRRRFTGKHPHSYLPSSVHLGNISPQNQNATHVLNNLDSAVSYKDGDYPELEIHGLWNSQFCGTFLRKGDTRVFFLKKMKDHHKPRMRKRRELRKRKNRKGGNQKRTNKKKMRKSKKGSGGLKNMSESMETKWKRMLKKPKSMKRNKKRTSKTPRSFSVLLVNSEPARISLKNLQNVSSLVK